MKTINVSDETYEIIKNQLSGKDLGSSIFEKAEALSDLVGSNLFIRTVTYHSVGHVLKVVGDFVILKNSSWVADSGRFMNALRDGTLDEVEPTGYQGVNINSIVDFFEWKHPLPTEQK